MTKNLSLGLFFSLLIFASSLFFILKTDASDFQGKDTEDIVTENFNSGGVINIMSPSGKGIVANYNKEFGSTISKDKRKGEIYFEKRECKSILKVNKIKLLFISPNGSVDIYI